MAFRRARGTHIDGHKEMSLNFDIENYLDPNNVYIPLVEAGPLKLTVEVGEHVLMGQVIALREGRFGHPVHSSCSGKVIGVKKMWHSSGKMVEMLQIENDHTNESVECDVVNPDALSKEELVEIMKEKGIVGLGGAGFPMYAQYTSNAEVEQVIINLVECEPYLTSDYIYALHNADSLVYGLKYMIKAADAKAGVIVLKDKELNRDLIAILEQAVSGYDNISIKLVKDIYPAGWEKYIVEQVTGKTYNGLPIEVGAIVGNASTAITFAKSLKTGLPLIEKVITITGEGIKEPRNFLVKVGTPVKELITRAGGYITDLDSAKYVYVAGGPMTGNAILIDELIISSTLGAVIILKDLTNEKDHPACLGCGKCSTVCPVHLTPILIKRELEGSKEVSELKALGTTKCISCGLCSYICPSRIELTQAMEKAKELIRKAVK